MSLTAVFPGSYGHGWLAGDHNLAPGVRLRFQQYRVHVDTWFQARCLCLHHLGPPHFFSISGYKRVQRHVLGLKRGNPESILLEDTA